MLVYTSILGAIFYIRKKRIGYYPVTKSANFKP